MQVTMNRAALSHKQRVIEELYAIGVSRLGFSRFGMRHVPESIQPTEHIQGIVYGYDKGNAVILLATDKRVIFLDRKPFYYNQEDVSYGMIGGVSFSHAGFGSTVVLHTRIRDFTVHTFNHKAATRFVQFIEMYYLDQNPQVSY